MKRIKKRGFTLVELIIVIAVIAILAAVLIPTFITVIDNANDSADTQLVVEMNTVVAGMDKTDNKLATADNIRAHLSHNGITKIATKNKKNIIVFDTQTSRFEKLDFSDADIGDIVARAYDLFITKDPYSIEDIIDGKILVSTEGNKLSEALYNLHNLPGDVDSAYIKAQLKLIDDEEIKATVIGLLNTTAFVTKDGSVKNVEVNGDTVRVADGANGATRVLFHESVTTFDIGNLRDAMTGVGVIIPDYVQEVNGTIERKIIISGNTAALPKELLTAENITVEATIVSAKEIIAEGNGAMRVKKDYYVKKDAVGEDDYTDLAIALNDAAASYNLSHEPRRVTIADKDIHLSQSATLASGVTLDIPYYNQNGYFSGYGDGVNSDNDPIYGASKGFADKSKMQFELVVDEGATLTVNGDIMIGGVISYPGQYYNGHTSGNYGQITNNGSIVVESGADVDIYGYITGSGSMTAKSGSKVFEPFVVMGFSGGWNSYSLYSAGQSPFLRYAAVNIQCPFTVEYGALLYVHCNLYASSSYNKTDEVLIGYFGEEHTDEPTNGLINLFEGASVLCTYGNTPLISAESVNKSQDATEKALANNLAYGDLCKTTLTVKGRAETGALSLMDFVTTSNVLFPIPYNFDFVIDGDFYINNKYVLLPGASVTVRSTGTLTIKDKAEFYVMDALYEGADMAGKKYPSSELLTANSLHPYASLVVNGTLHVEGKAGGIINTSQAGGTVVISADADLSGEFTLGGVGSYAANTSLYSYPLRIADADAEGRKLFHAAVGCTYQSTSDSVQSVPVSASVTSLKKRSDSNEFDVTVDNKYYSYQTVEKSVTMETIGVWQQPEAEAQGQVSAFSEPQNNFSSLATAITNYNLSSAAVQKILSTRYSTWVKNLCSAYYTDYRGLFEHSAQGNELAELAINAELAYKAQSRYVQDILGAHDKAGAESENALYSTVQNVRAENPLELSVRVGENGETEYKASLTGSWADITSQTEKVFIKLYNDITITETLTIPNGANIDFDLNGFTITGKYSGTMQNLIDNRGSLYLHSSSARGTIELTSSEAFGASDAMISSGSLNIENISVLGRRGIGIEGGNVGKIENIVIDTTANASNSYNGLTIENADEVLLIKDVTINSVKLGLSIAINDSKNHKIGTIEGLVINSKENNPLLIQVNNGNLTIDRMANCTFVNASTSGYSSNDSGYSIKLHVASNCTLNIGEIVGCAFTGQGGVKLYSGDSNPWHNENLVIDSVKSVNITAAFNASGSGDSTYDGVHLEGLVEIKSFEATVTSPDTNAIKAIKGAKITIGSGYFKSQRERVLIQSDTTGKNAGFIYLNDQYVSENTTVSEAGEGGYYTLVSGGITLEFYDHTGERLIYVYVGKDATNFVNVSIETPKYSDDGYDALFEKEFKYWTSMDGEEQVDPATVTQNTQFKAHYDYIADVVTIDGKGYRSMKSAMEEVQDGETIRLLADVFNETVTIPADRSISIDLNGHKLHNPNGEAIIVKGTLQKLYSSAASKGEVASKADFGVYAIVLESGAKIDEIENVKIIAGGATEGGKYAGDTIFIKENATIGSIKETVELSNVYRTGKAIVVTGGTLESFRGNIQCEGTGIDATGGSVTISGGTIHTDSVAVRVTNNGIFTMTGGTIISSNTSQTLQFNSGAQVTISEGNVINTCTTTAAKAISFTGNGTLKIEGGVIASLNGDGILCNSANGSATVTISGGYIVGKANNTRKNFAVNNSGWTVTITGGYFGTSDPSASFTTGENILMLFNGIAGISAENFDVAQKEERKVDNIGTITFYAFQANSR